MATNEHLENQFKFVIDLTKQSKRTPDITPIINRPDPLLTKMDNNSYYVALELLNWHKQIYLDDECRHLYSFLSTNSNVIKCSTRAVPGNGPSETGCAIHNE